MSVAKFTSQEISRLALFAGAMELGAPDLVGQLIFNQNLRAYNERYNEQHQEVFSLVKDVEMETVESLYSFAHYVKSNCYTDDFETSKGYELLNKILSEAIYPTKGSAQTFDDVIGKAIRLKGIYQSTGFIVSKNGDLLKAVYFDFSSEEWKIATPSHLVWNSCDYDIQLSVEQATGLATAIEKRQQLEMAKRMEAQQRRREKEDLFTTEFFEKKPDFAKSYIIAEYMIDESDMQSDYHGGRTDRRIILAWSKHNRNLFSEFRKAAKNHPDTAFLAEADKSCEHRENWSMGGGYYLSAGHRYKGWKISKTSIGEHSRPAPAEWAIPGEGTKSVSQGKKDDHLSHKKDQTSDGQDEVKELLSCDGHRLVKNLTRNNLEVHSAEKPTKAFIHGLKSAGFRYYVKGRFWYSKATDDALVAARSLVKPIALSSTLF